MNKAKKLLLSALSAACLTASAFGIAACSVDVPTTTPVVKYYVGDNADVFDFIEYQSGATYSFTYTVNGGEAIELEGQSIYLAAQGEYQVTANVETAEGKGTVTFSFNVYNPVPYLLIGETEVDIPLDASRSQRALINMASPKVISDVEYDTYVDYVLIYKEQNGEPEKVEIKDGVATSDGFYDGSRFHFIYECEHTFVLAAESSGGRSTKEFTVNVAEDLSELTYLGEPVYNSQTRVVSWDPVEGAASYRVKFGTVAVETEDATTLSLDVDDYVKSEYYYFDIAVIPKDADGKKMAKYVYEGVVVAPEGNEALVLGRGVTSIDSEKMEATLLGCQSYSAGWSTGLDSSLNNSHIAFVGNYGVNTFVEFTFKGNNMPNVMFFADNINGNLSKNGGKGYILMNGLFSTTDDRTIGGDRLVVVGPNRFSSDNYKSVSENRPAAFTMSTDALLTQEGLEKDTSGRTYRYVVGAVDIAGKLGFTATLYVDGTDEVVAQGTFKTATNVSDAGYGNIVAYAPVKGTNNNATFGYCMPYNLEQEIAGGRVNTDGSVTLDGRTEKAANASQISAIDNSYFAFKGNYGVGKYVNVYFTGNNMPSVMFFADDINGNMTSDGGKGLLIGNGYGAANDKLYVFGPERIGNAGASATTGNGYADNLSKLLEITDCPLLTKAGLAADTSGKNYKLRVGTYENEDGYLTVDIQLYDADTEEAIYNKQYATTVKANVFEAGNVVLYGAMNGEQSPIRFSYDMPYTKGRDVILTSGATYNEDDSVTMTGIRPVHIGYGSGVGPTGTSDSYLGWNDQEYGAGYKLDFYYTGNNMPYVTFFADSVNGYIGGNRATDQGIMLINGLVSAGNKPAAKDQVDTLKYDAFNIWGPNKYKGIEAETGIQPMYSTTEYPALMQSALNTTYADTDFHYSVGTFVHPITGIVYIDVKLYTVASDGTETLLYAFDVNTTYTEETLTGRCIVVYAPLKGLNKDTTFFFTSPYKYTKDPAELGVISLGMTENTDGSVTLAGGDDQSVSYTGQTFGVGVGSGVSTYKNNYVAFPTEYGVGTYVDTTFTGDNMPQVMLFGGEVNCWIGKGHESYANGAPVGQTGYLITNYVTAFNNSTTNVKFMDFLYCSGPNRISQNVNAPTKSNFTFTSGAYTALEEGVEYKYTVGSKLVDGKVVIEATLSKADGTTLYVAEYATGMTEAEAEALGGYIVLYAGVKGCDANKKAYSTTFKYSAPYTK